MAKSKKRQSATPGLIIIGSIVLSIAMVNPVPFVFALIFVFIFDDKL